MILLWIKECLYFNHIWKERNYLQKLFLAILALIFKKTKQQQNILEVTNSDNFISHYFFVVELIFLFYFENFKTIKEEIHIVLNFSTNCVDSEISKILLSSDLNHW